MAIHYQHIQVTTLKRHLLALCLLLIAVGTTARNIFGYTDERPLIVACDWDFRPFEFMNANGQPDGYNIEVLNLILDNLDIPHRFLMQEWKLTTETFEHREADLIHALSFTYKGHPYIQTQKYINYYTLKTARRQSTPPLKSIKHLRPNDTVLLKQNDYADLELRAMGDTMLSKQYQSPKNGLANIQNGLYQYYIWGEAPLRQKIKELGLDSLVLDDIDIPAGELRIIGYDGELIDAIDDQFTRLEQAGDLQPITDKWFHPERHHDDASPVALFLLIGLALLIIVLLLLSRLVTLRVKSVVRRSEDLSNVMQQALGMGNYYVLEYDINSHYARNAYGQLLPPDGISGDELISRIADDQQAEFREALESLKAETCNEWTRHLRWNAGTPDNPDWRELTDNAILEMKDNRPRYIIHTLKDITLEMQDEQRNAATAEKYMKVFETNLIAMSFYNSQGQLIDLNQKMRELCELQNAENERMFREMTIFDSPLMKDDYPLGSRYPIHFCQAMRYPALGISKYIEMRITPIIGDSDKIAYYVVTSRDVTAERELYKQQQQRERELHKVNAAVLTYEDRLRYLLEQSKMFVWVFDLETKCIEFSHTLRKSEYHETIEEYFDRLEDEHSKEAKHVMASMVMQGKPFNVIHEFKRSPLHNSFIWCSISGMPIHDKEGHVKRYFGLVRDITDLMQAQQLLREETSRAQDSGQMKAAFLANMTHEIRTPLNAIVGFSDLLQMVEAPEERQEFIRIIRDNCDMLLRLINDILEASNMGQSLTIEPSDIDLAATFNDICQILEQRVQEPGVQFLRDNPYQTFPAYQDRGRLQQVLTNFVTNAVKYTHQGHIKVGYCQQARDEQGLICQEGLGQQGLYFYCEDTGAGIPKEKQASVFERFVKLNDFVQGTGLGLSICRAIVEKCGGYIGVNSEGEGHGSTFWFWLPVRIAV